MAVDPSGPESLPLSRLRTSLSESSTFRVWTGVATAEQALARIHYIGSEDPTALMRPYAIVSHVDEDGFSARRDGIADVNTYLADGEVALVLFASINPANSIPDQVHAFVNKTGAIIKELCTTAATVAGRFDFDAVRRARGPLLCNDDEHSDEVRYCESTYVFSYSGSPVE